MGINIRGIVINDKSDIEDILSAFSILSSEVEILKNELAKQLTDYDNLSNDLRDDYIKRKELVQAISDLQIQAQELLKYSKSISEQNKTYYQDVKLSIERELASLNQKIAKTITETVEDLPLEKLNVEVLSKIEFAFVHFDALKRNLTNLQKELEHMQKYSRAILDDVENATIRSNRLNDRINSKMNKINVFLGVIGGVVVAFLLQNYEFFLNIGANIKTIITNWQGYLVIFTLVMVAGASIFSVWWIIYNIVKEKEEKRYIV